jgi:ATP-dependent DNA helicase RecG
MNGNYFQTPLTYLKGVGPSRAELLSAELGILTYQDLVNLFPNRYLDKTRYYTIRELERTSAEVQLIGKVTHLKTVEQKNGKRLVAKFVDESGHMELVWFRALRWIKESIQLNTPYVVYGRVQWFNGNFSMAHPEMELVTEHEKGIRIAMQPVYPSTEKLLRRGVTNRVLNRLMQQLFAESKGYFAETLPPSLLDTLGLLPKKEAMYHIHFPESQSMLAKASFRLKFEELFYIQLQLLRKKQMRKSKIRGHTFVKVGTFFNTFYRDHLPFSLTGAQKKVIREIRADLGSNAQMNRLLQGDVGSGKTIVALMAMLLAIDNGFQACLVAPTEILAIQHYNDLKELLGGIDVSVSLLTGSVKKAKRTKILSALEEGGLDILVGTHAVLEERVRFSNLGLAVIDEQHRFGVAQRAKLWHKNEIPPHILVMTATPIPRTLAMSLYGDLDISVIDELPPGRKPVKTVHRTDANRLKVFRFLKDEIKKGRQVYIVYPLIQESEALDYKDLMDGYESLSRDFPKPGYQISIVHGQMKPEDKDFEMARFIKGETQLMIATTVIEVGVNIPNASVMVVESAERFGLSQLHQLRGRVGRGADQSYCILMSGNKVSGDAKTRLQTMVSTSDGFEIAEVDLRLRGPGDLMGTQQSGILNLKIADVVKDSDILKTARYWAMEVLKEDPELTLEKHRAVRKTYLQLGKNSNIWTYIS